ncbi:single-strand DNA-binding protein [Halanaerobium saccharolyticum]|uniref:Single-stranded DNA-binding protein n=1 Tax=Halanaerobium saccharolyticum TaxID=43595 RepID=A0A4V3G4C1_9FIRM|nr:single-stranded DNA-binding protein [Halanaerobium saccharolyticum]RAK05452.1 single-strand DNA-binding protein [Halanaerobium saccharolyticum]TDV99787.1 single-strand DNA-binding protein [Halanaerobium saccharolyticum]TDX52009.1 single-strand DNA-binding protein [Halanaerobium saccharolyticum]
MLNRIVLIGRLTRDPELRYTSNGTPVCNFTLAVERNYTNRDGDRDVDFINIVTWRGLAENCARHLGKGRLVGVDGSLQIRKSENNNRTYINPEVNADNVRFLDFGNSNSRSNNQGQAQNSQNNKNQQQKSSAQQNKKQEQDDFDAQFDDNFDADDFDVPF